MHSNAPASQSLSEQQQLARHGKCALSSTALSSSNTVMFKDKGPSAGLTLQGRSAISSGCKDCIAGGCKGNFQKFQIPL